MLVAGSWRRVDEQKVQFAPLYVCNKLANGRSFFRATPQNGLVFVLQKRIHGDDRQVFVVRRRNHQLGGFVNFNRAGKAQKVGHAWAVNVDIKNANLKPAPRQRRSGIDGHRAFAHAALAAHNKYLVANMAQAVGYCAVLLGHRVITFPVAAIALCTGARGRRRTG